MFETLFQTALERVMHFEGALAGFVPEGHRKLAGGANRRFAMYVRWFAPPANFRDASGVGEPCSVRLEVHDSPSGDTISETLLLYLLLRAIDKVSDP